MCYFFIPTFLGTIEPPDRTRCKAFLTTPPLACAEAINPLDVDVFPTAIIRFFSVVCDASLAPHVFLAIGSYVFF